MTDHARIKELEASLASLTEERNQLRAAQRVAYADGMREAWAIAKNNSGTRDVLRAIDARIAEWLAQEPERPHTESIAELKAAYEESATFLSQANDQLSALTEEREGLRAALQFVLDNSGDPVMERVAQRALASPEGHQQDKDQEEKNLTRADTTGSHVDSRTAATDPKGSA